MDAHPVGGVRSLVSHFRPTIVCEVVDHESYW
jgi:hypothetical protein